MIRLYRLSDSPIQSSKRTEQQQSVILVYKKNEVQSPWQVQRRCRRIDGQTVGGLAYKSGAIAVGT